MSEHRIEFLDLQESNISKWAEFGKAHQEVFGDHPPTTTMVEVKQLIDTEMLIEIEADAYAGEL